MRRVELSDMVFGQIVGELRMLKAQALNLANSTSTMTPERKAGRDHAEYLHELAQALNKAETF